MLKYGEPPKVYVGSQTPLRIAIPTQKQLKSSCLLVIETRLQLYLYSFGF